MVLALGLAALAGCGGHDGTASDEAARAGSAARLGPDDVATAATADVAAGVPISGPLEPAYEVKLISPFADVVETVRVREGQAVNEGQVLARFRSGVLGSQAASAEAKRRIAASQLERMQNLKAAGAVSQNDVENAEVALKAAEAEAAQAGKQSEDATVRSPIAGVVSRSVVQSGDRVGEGDVLFEVVNTSELELEASVPSEYVTHVRVGAAVRLEVTGYEGRVVEGRIARVNATADPATRQVKVYVRVPNRERKLVGGLFASGQLVTGAAVGVVAVPTAAVREGDTVWVAEGGKLASRKVVTGVRDEAKDLIEIRSGIRAGETVVVGPVEGLRAGQAVAVATRES
jgi:RND family efflux transporter MFP subunit